jgi:oxaloacetate decarboxylase gamma subunit
MNGNMLEALMLMGIGMSAVFVVLLIIIFFGNILVSIVNKFFPEEVVAPKEAPTATIAPDVAQAISKAVAQLTGGKGKVEKIEKA